MPFKFENGGESGTISLLMTVHARLDKNAWIPCATIGLAMIAFYAIFSYASLQSTQITTKIVPDTPIVISSNSDFSTYASSGDGSATNPWIIESKYFSFTSSATAISISDTTDHFILRNITVVAGTIIAGAGIFFSNVINGTIEWTIIDNMKFGIRIFGGSQNITVNNVSVDHAVYGIEFRNDVNNVTVKNNTIRIRALSTENGHGIRLPFTTINVDNLLLYNNIFRGLTSNTYGIGYGGFDIKLCENWTISNNTIEGFSIGTFLHSTVASDNNMTIENSMYKDNSQHVTINNLVVTIRNNTIEGDNALLTPSNHGIKIQASNCIVENNTIRNMNINTGVHPVYMRIYGYSNTVSNNTLFSPSSAYGTGIKIEGSNTISFNRIMTMVSLSVDGLTQNIYGNVFVPSTSPFLIGTYIGDITTSWDNGSIGNYYPDVRTKYPTAASSDGIWNTSYTVYGTSVDRFPLSEYYLNNDKINMTVIEPPPFPVGATWDAEVSVISKISASIDHVSCNFTNSTWSSSNITLTEIGTTGVFQQSISMSTVGLEDFKTYSINFHANLTNGARNVISRLIETSDIGRPVITINEPIPGETYLSPSLDVIATITDEDGVDGAWCVIANASGNQTNIAMLAPQGGDVYSATVSFELLASGTYWVEVSANDTGGNERTVLSSTFTLNTNFQAAIIISDNADFLAYASSGDGSTGDPYILNDLLFDMSIIEGIAINVTGTDAHFEIRECGFIGDNIIANPYAVTFINVTNGVIDNCSFSSSERSIFFNNTINSSVKNGNVEVIANVLPAVIRNSTGILVNNVTLEGPESPTVLNTSGFKIIGGDNVTVFNITFINVDHAVNAINVTNLTVQNNTFDHVYVTAAPFFIAIIIDNCNRTNVTGNWLYSAAGFLSSINGRDIEIMNNTLLGIRRDCMRLEGTENVSMIKNVIKGSIKYGMYVLNVNGSLIRNNTIIQQATIATWGKNGITVWDNSTVDGNVITNFNQTGQHGIRIWGNNNTITGNEIDSGDDGVSIRAYGGYNNITGNNTVYTVMEIDGYNITISNNTINALVNVKGANNTISGNVFDGMIVVYWTGENTTVWNNTFEDIGVTKMITFQGGAEGGLVYQNAFNVDPLATFSPCTDNQGAEWDNGSIGNFWANYEIMYPAAMITGVTWDAPYLVNAPSVYDNFPLVLPSVVNTPGIEIIQPLDGDTVSGLVFVEANITSKLVIDTVWVHVPGSGIDNVTLTTTNGTFYNGTVDLSPVTDGTWTLYVFVNNTVGLESNDSISITTNNFPPVVTIVSPIASSYIVVDSFTISADCTDDSDIDNVTYTVTNGSGILLSGIIPLTSAPRYETVLTSITLDDGEYGVNVIASDTLGRTTVESVAINIDFLDPKILAVSPLNNSVLLKTSHFIAIQVTDEDINTAYFSIDGGIETGFDLNLGGVFSQISETTFSTGPHVISVRATSNTGRESTATILFSINTDFPVINKFSFPEPGDIITEQVPSLVVSCTDSNGIDAVLLHVFNATINETFAFSIFGAFYEVNPNLSFLVDGMYTLQVFANDTNGRLSTISTTITIDLRPPVITNLGIINGTIIESSVTSINVDAFVLVKDEDIDSVGYTIVVNETIIYSGDLIGNSTGHYRKNITLNVTSGNYTLVIIAISNTGRSSTITIHFSVIIEEEPAPPRSFFQIIIDFFLSIVAFVLSFFGLAHVVKKNTGRGSI